MYSKTPPPEHINTTPSPAKDAKPDSLLPFFAAKQLEALQAVARQPCVYIPGSKAKISILAVRAALEMPLHQSGDLADMPERLALLPGHGGNGDYAAALVEELPNGTLRMIESKGKPLSMSKRMRRVSEMAAGVESGAKVEAA